MSPDTKMKLAFMAIGVGSSPARASGSARGGKAFGALRMQPTQGGEARFTQGDEIDEHNDRTAFATAVAELACARCPVRQRRAGAGVCTQVVQRWRAGGPRAWRRHRPRANGHAEPRHHHRPSAAGGDARTPGIDLTRAGALIERAHLVVTHTRRYSRALLEKVVPAIREVPWLEWELGLPDVDESIHLPTPRRAGSPRASPVCGCSRSRTPSPAGRCSPCCSRSPRRRRRRRRSPVGSSNAATPQFARRPRPRPSCAGAFSAPAPWARGGSGERRFLTPFARPRGRAGLSSAQLRTAAAEPANRRPASRHARSAP